jgi:flavin reductase (DIM6/NTAB) family NADH-FMN oxidoreductase RutF
MHPIYNEKNQHTATVVWGRVVCFHVHEGVLAADGKQVDITKLRPISRAGGNTYVTMGDTFDLPRPKVA